MALIQCPECNKDVSDKAATCIHCGNPLNQPAQEAAYATVVQAAPQGKKGNNVSIGTVVIAIFVVVVGIYSEFNDSKSPNPVPSSSTANVPEVTSAPTQTTAEFATTAYELELAYAKNTVAADNRYKGHRFSISGTVAEINTDITDSAVIELVNPANEFNQPHAELAGADKQKAASLTKGQKITLNCLGQGDVVKTPMLKDCTIQDVAKPSASSESTNNQDKSDATTATAPSDSESPSDRTPSADQTTASPVSDGQPQSDNSV